MPYQLSESEEPGHGLVAWESLEELLVGVVVLLVLLEIGKAIEMKAVESGLAAADVAVRVKSCLIIEELGMRVTLGVLLVLFPHFSSLQSGILSRSPHILKVNLHLTQYVDLLPDALFDAIEVVVDIINLIFIGVKVTVVFSVLVFQHALLTDDSHLRSY